MSRQPPPPNSVPEARQTQPTKKIDDPFKDTKESAPKRKRNPKPWLWALVLLLFGTIAVFTTVILYQPGMLGLARIPDLAASDEALQNAAAQTGQAVETTRLAVEGTSIANQNRERDLQGTIAALNNREDLLQQTLAQVAFNNASTATAIAVSNAQQATLAAVAREGTQAALIQAATQAQHDFEATQTALIGQFPTPEPTLPANILTTDAGFVTGSETNRWDALPLSEAWALTDNNTLLARVPNATLLTAWGDFGENYALVAEITPVLGAQAYYDVIFGLDQTGVGYALRLWSNGTIVTEADLYSFDVSALANGLLMDRSRLIAINQNLAIPADRLDVRLDIRGNSVNVAFNGQGILTAALPLAAGQTRLVGAVGVQVPVGSHVARLRVLPA